MLYVITEDENSGRYFWCKVVTTFQKEGTYEIVDLPMGKDGKRHGGNTSLEAQVNYVFDKIKEGDTLFIAIDNIGDTRNFYLTEFLDVVQHSCDRLGVALIVTNYYCFEELYLSYTGLYEICKDCQNVGKDEIELLYYVNGCINKGIDYYNSDNPRVNELMKNAIGLSRNREHFANALLSKVTSGIKGYFKISKKVNSFGKCWLESCTSLRQNSNDKHIKYFCKNCKFCCKDCDTREKLLDLRYRSLITTGAGELSN